MDIQDLNSKLKYFYLIDMDTTINDLQSSMIHMPSSADGDELLDVFLSVWKKIAEVSEPYTRFILSSSTTNHSSLFGELPGDVNAVVFTFLSQTSLFHHCIMQGFKKSLQEHITRTGHSYKTGSKDYLNFDSDSPYIKLSATTMPVIKKGCIYSFINGEKHTFEYGSIEHQNFNGKSKRVLKNTDDYSVQLIQHFRKLAKTTPANQIFIDKTESTPVAFLFANREVSAFNTVLNRKEYQYNTFLEKYKILWTSYMSERSTFSNADKALFDMVLEYSYGFSLFDYIYRLFYDMEYSASFKRIKNMDGTAFHEIISDYLAALPITYNRSIFMKYACEAILKSPNLDSSYPPTSPKGMQYYSFTPAPEIPFSSKALNIMDTFFRLLTYSVLPLIENLWFVLTDALKIDYTIYLKFIEQHYSVISYNYFSLPVDIFLKDGLVGLPFRESYDILCTYVREHENSPLSSILFSDEKSDKLLGNLHKGGFCDTLKRQCTVIDPALRKDLVHHILNPLQDRENYFFEQEQFKKHHASKIYEFAKSLDWKNLAAISSTRETD